MSQPESRLSRDIRRELEARDAFVFKIHGGPTMMAGLPDLIACVPRYLHGAKLPSGLFVGLETKMPGNHPTTRQAYVHDRIRAAGGLVVVPHSVREALDAVWAMDVPPDTH